MDLSSYTPIFVRVTGNDANDGLSVAAPKLTAQAAYDEAFASSGLHVLDFGANTETMPDFGPIVLTADWPVRIAVRGAGEYESLLGGISGAVNVEIVGNNTVNLGDIFLGPKSDGNGGSVSLTNIRTFEIETRGLTAMSPGDGGNITLVDCRVTGAHTIGGGGYENTLGGMAGHIQIRNSDVAQVTADGGMGWLLNGNGGVIDLDNSTVTSGVSAMGGQGGDESGDGGIITITNNSSVGSVHSNGPSGVITGRHSTLGEINNNAKITTQSDQTGGSGGCVDLQDCEAGGIYAYGYSSDSGGGHGGSIELTRSTANRLYVNGGYSFFANEPGDGGVVVLTDSVIGESSAIWANGGDFSYYLTYGKGGVGGSITLIRSSAINLNAYGGYGSNDNGGNGGTITLVNSTADTLIADSIGMQGGGLDSGNGGTVSLTDSSVYSISATSGNSDQMSGNGGTITIVRSEVAADVLATADVGCNTPGAGGFVSLHLSRVGGQVNVSAADCPSNVGGDGGSIDIFQSTAGWLLAKGGDSWTDTEYYALKGGDGGTITLTNMSQANALETITVAGGGGAIAGQDGTVNLIYSPPDILGAGLL